MIVGLRQLGVSAAIYALVIGCLFIFRIEGKPQARIVQVVSTIIEAPEKTNFLDLLQDKDEPVDLNAAVSLMPQGTASVAGSTPTPMPMVDAGNGPGPAGVDPVRERSLVRPLATALTTMELDANVSGLVGPSIPANTIGGDSGSVDFITKEILRQLDKSKVLVVWVLDASGSMRERRQQVVDRFERIYKELEVLGKEGRDAVLTAVVAFGQRTSFLTKDPTADRQELKKAVASIKTDDSGRENVFTAIKDAVLTYRKYQTHGKRSMMVIALTDERGDDMGLMDDVVELVKRRRIPVYVLGPMAPFGRASFNVAIQHAATGRTVYRPVERGPESIESEHLALPYWDQGGDYDLFGSGFGPYALSRIARESGGIYFVYDDGKIPAPKFLSYDLQEYAPEYVDLTEYRQGLTKHPIRAAVVRAAEESKGALGEPPMLFTMDTLTARIPEAQRVAAQTEHFVDRALSYLRAAEKYRDKEPSKRWLAEYDLMMGRLLATRVRCGEYNWILARMKLNPKTPADKKNNAWLLVADAELSFGKKDTPDTRKAETNVRKSDPKALSRAKEDAELAQTYLKRVTTEHPSTPWSMMAQRELSTPMGFRWKETYIVPEPKPGQTLTADQQRMMEDRKKQAEAEAAVKGL